MTFEIVSYITLGIWIYLLLFRGWFWRIRNDAAPLPGDVPTRTVVAVIPARNEAATIQRTVASLATQTIPVVVVDDHSTDGTGDLARSAGAEVVEARPLPQGWTGKLWALSQGVERALERRPDYLLFTDADIEHAPDSLAALLTCAEAWNLDIASFMVRLHVGNAAERLMIPAFVFFFLKLYPQRWIADRAARTAGAAGGCILIRTSALERIGGIASIRGQLIDDCSLAREVKRSGGRLWMGLTSTTRSIRPYDTLSEIRAMIARTAFTQLDHSALLLAGTVLGMFFTYLAPPLFTLMGSPFAAAAYLIMAATYIPMLRFYGLGWWYAFALPFVAAFYSFATVESAVQYWSGSGGQWKGRSQDVH